MTRKRPARNETITPAVMLALLARLIRRGFWVEREAICQDRVHRI